MKSFLLAMSMIFIGTIYAFAYPRFGGSEGWSDIDEDEASASTGLREVAQQMRESARICRASARQSQMNSQQMAAMYGGYMQGAAFSASMNNAAQVASQFADLYDRMADEWDDLADEEVDYFEEMRGAKSRTARTEMFVRTKNKLRRMAAASDVEGAWKLYMTSRRAIMAFRRSIDPSQNAEEWVAAQDQYYIMATMQQTENLRSNAMNMAMQFYADSDASFRRSLNASKLPSRRCGACNKQYYGYGNCPHCSGPRYGLSSKLINDDHNSDEKLRIYW